MSTPRRRNREGKQGAFRGEQYDLGRIREPTHLHLRGVRVVVSWEKRFCVVAASTDPRYCRDEGGRVMSQHHDPEFTSRIARLTFIVPPAPFFSPPGPEFAYASDEAGLVQRITDSTGTHYCTASWPVDHDGDEDFEPRLRVPTGFRWEPVLERPTMRVLSTTQRETPRRDDQDATSALSEAMRTQLQRLAGEVRQQLDAARWQAARHGVAGTAPTTPWREWAAKILAAYPWVGEFRPDDSDEKYRDGVRYVLLCIECDGDSSIELHVEMQDIRVKWGFS